MARSMTLWVAATTRSFSTFLEAAKSELLPHLSLVHQALELLLVRTPALQPPLTLDPARPPLQAVVCHAQVLVLLQLEMLQTQRKFAN